MLNRLSNKIFTESCHPIALATFRILFGSIMFISGLRFYAKGWIEEFYLEPTFHFKYFGFEWVNVLPQIWLYAIFILMLISALGIAFGLFYRLSTILYFLSFTYFELLDKTLYLNHYYFVSLVALLLIFIPANSYLALDNYIGLKPVKRVKRLYIVVLQTQIAILYFFAGIAKINTDWLFEGQPMDIWLDKFHYLPLIGTLLTYKTTAIVFSWFGMVYDTALPFLLWSKKTRVYAYIAVIVFHGATALLFPIGVFPYVMMALTLLFFPASAFRKLKKIVPKIKKHSHLKAQLSASPVPKKLAICLALHLFFQLTFPLRHYLYKGNVLWTEEGFNFSWRVMLVEKSGVANFFIKTDTDFLEVNNAKYLSPLQEKMMSTQSDFILQYAQFLKKEYSKNLNTTVGVYADVFVTLNGRPPRRYINPTSNLAEQKDSFNHKTWILQ